MDVRTHRAIDRRLSGEPVALGPGWARVAMTAGAEMAADEQGLVHGGFLFALADHAAMLAVNHPHVVLARAEVHFHRPVRVGESLEAEARVTGGEGRRRRVRAIVRRGEAVVMEGDFACVVPSRHVL
ncbi:MAG TPA: PaaI family thioesterase [Thermoanaerobaculia bacterium]|nr:PaaI family thioesterase [Thermoanaerobaculia bacterium]